MAQVEFLPRLSDSSRVWVYTSSRVFTSSEVAEMNRVFSDFVSGWTAHDQRLRADYQIYENRFVILSVDESLAGASGCSIDKSVNLMKNLGSELNIDFFDRMLFSYIDDNGEVQVVSSTAFTQLHKEGVITDDTIVFNPLVKTLAQVKSDFQVKLKDSWHSNFV